MARTKGIFSFTGYFDVNAAAPLDTRITVSSYDDLIDPEVWKSDDGQAYLYNGLTVSVQSTGDIYVLTDATAYTSTSSWKKVGNEPTVWDSEDLGWPTSDEG